MKLSLRALFYFLIVPLAAVLIALLVAGILPFFTIQSDLDNIERELAYIQAAGQFASAFTNQSREYADFVVTGDADEKREIRGAAASARTTLARWRALAEADQSGELTLIRKIETAYADISATGETVIRLVEEDRRMEAADVVTQQIQPAVTVSYRTVDQSIVDHRERAGNFISRIAGGIAYSRILRFGRLQQGIRALDAHVMEVQESAALRKIMEREIHGYWYFVLTHRGSDHPVLGDIAVNRYRADQALIGWRTAIRNSSGPKNSGGPNQQEERRFVDEVEREYRLLQEHGNEILRLVRSDEHTAAHRLLIASLEYDHTPVSRLLEKFMAQEAGVVAANVAYLKREVRRVRVALMAGAIAALLLGLGIPWVLSRSMITPLLKLQSAAERIGTGELDTQVEVPSLREMAALATTFNQMTRDLRTSHENLRASEERFQLAAQATNDMIWDYDARTGQAWKSPRYETWAGIHSDRPSWTERIHPEDRERVLAGVDAASKGTEELWSDEYRLRRADGTYAFVYDRAHYVRDAEGKPVRIIGALMDMTEKHEVNRIKAQFVSTVSHELRTPLTSIRGALGLLRTGLLGGLSEKGQRMLDIAVSNTDRLARLINDILDIERLDSGQVSLVLNEIEPLRLMQQAVDVMKTMAEKAGVVLRARPYRGVVTGDQDRLIQVLTNLLSNAIKFSPSGSTITVSAERLPGVLRFRVSDQGRGIPADKCETIFERFQQVDASDARDKGGTGLGLSICRSIVQQHGGKIWVESVVGQGSDFLFTIPLQDQRGLAQPAPGRTVLVCDDDESVRQILKELLQTRGYDVLTADSGSKAIELAKHCHPRAILLDLLMPGMSGWEVMAALKESPETCAIPILVASVLSPTEGGRLAEARPDQVAGWISKPLDESHLFETLERVAGRATPAPKILLVEEDRGLAGALRTMFEADGVTVFLAADVVAAAELTREVRPDLLVLDVARPETNSFDAVQWLRNDPHLRGIPVVVYSRREISVDERLLQEAGTTEFFRKGRIAPEQFEQKVLGMLAAILENDNGGTEMDDAQARTGR